MVHENSSFRPHYRQIKRWLDQERIGRPVQADMSLLTSWLVRDTDGRLPALVRQPMLATLEQMLLKELLIHHADTRRFLFGELTLNWLEVGRQSDAVIGDDHAFLATANTDGAPVTPTGNLCAWGYPGEAFDRLEILGGQGRILPERDRLTLQCARAETLQFDLAANDATTYPAIIELSPMVSPAAASRRIGRATTSAPCAWSIRPMQRAGVRRARPSRSADAAP
jgi:predicted dehydrogenase